MSNQKKDCQSSNSCSDNKNSYSNRDNDMHGANGHDGNNGMYGMDRTSGRTATMDTETHREWDKSLGEHDEHDEHDEHGEYDEHAEGCCDGKYDSQADFHSKDGSWESNKSGKSGYCSNNR